ncbi:MAG: type III secretion system chaperone [Kiritimatiellae bacterium]|nr:type III secretion system chaperone [Kiritimatiellia bacterium]
MTFGELIDVLGKRLGVEIEDAGGAAALEIDGETVVLQDAGELLLVRAEVGEIPADGREGILASAMEANFLYQGTGGATLAVNPADGRLHLQKYNWMERLDADSVLAAIGNMADTAAAWRRVLADYRSSSWRPETSAPPIGSEPLLQV